MHINNNNNNNKTLSNGGGSIKSEIISNKEDHAYEQIYIKPDELIDTNKKHSDDFSESW